MPTAGKQVASAGGAKPLSNGFGVAAQQKLPPIKSEQKQPAEASTDEKTGKGGVAFDIPVGSGGDAAATAGPSGAGADIDKILRKPLPPRLRHLEPLENAPSISPEQLAEKLKKAEEKRERMLEKRRNSNVTKQSKARRELLKAQDYSQQEALDEAGATTAAGASAPSNPEAERLQQKQAVAEQKRLAKLAAVQERQRLREERAKAAREKARRLKEEEQMEAELNIEKDEGGGESDSDASWLGEGDSPADRNRRDRTAGAANSAGTAASTTAGLDDHQAEHRDSSGYGSSRGGGNSSVGGSRATTGKTVSTVLEDDRDKDFFD